MILTNLLSSSSFIMTNKILIKAVGLEAAVFLSELCSEYNYWEEQGSLKDKCWFYSTRQNIEENTGLSEHKQRCAMNLLIKMNLISTKKIGSPCKVYYKLNEKNILDCYEENRKYQDFKSKQNNKKMTFEQREYPSGFFDNLFAN